MKRNRFLCRLTTITIIISLLIQNIGWTALCSSRNTISPVSELSTLGIEFVKNYFIEKVKAWSRRKDLSIDTLFNLLNKNTDNIRKDLDQKNICVTYSQTKLELIGTDFTITFLNPALIEQGDIKITKNIWMRIKVRRKYLTILDSQGNHKATISQDTATINMSTFVDSRCNVTSNFEEASRSAAKYFMREVQRLIYATFSMLVTSSIDNHEGPTVLQLTSLLNPVLSQDDLLKLLSKQKWKKIKSASNYIFYRSSGLIIKIPLERKILMEPRIKKFISKIIVLNFINWLLNKYYYLKYVRFLKELIKKFIHYLKPQQIIGKKRLEGYSLVLERAPHLIVPTRIIQDEKLSKKISLDGIDNTLILQEYQNRLLIDYIKELAAKENWLEIERVLDRAFNLLQELWEYRIADVDLGVNMFFNFCINSSGQIRTIDADSITDKIEEARQYCKTRRDQAFSVLWMLEHLGIKGALKSLKKTKHRRNYFTERLEDLLTNFNNQTAAGILRIFLDTLVRKFNIKDLETSWGRKLTDPPKSYTGKGGRNREAHPSTETAFQQGTAVDATNHYFTLMAKDVLLGDSNFTAKDHDFAAASHDGKEFSEIRIMLIPDLPLDGHYGMGGEVNQHTLPTIYIPKILFEHFLDRFDRDIDSQAYIKLADYIYHKYMEMRLIEIDGLDPKLAHEKVDHTDYESENNYITRSTFAKLINARIILLNWINKRNLGVFEDMISSADKLTDYITEGKIAGLVPEWIEYEKMWNNKYFRPYHPISPRRHLLFAFNNIEGEYFREIIGKYKLSADDLLCLRRSLFLHDFGKIQILREDPYYESHADHPKESEKIAKIILLRLGYNLDEIEDDLILIRFHSALADLSRFGETDIAPLDFVISLKNIRNLHLLQILQLVDAASVRQEFENSLSAGLERRINELTGLIEPILSADADTRSAHEDKLLKYLDSIKIQNKKTFAAYNSLKNSLKGNNMLEDDKSKILFQKAFLTMQRSHLGQLRKDKETPAAVHCLETAQILVDEFGVRDLEVVIAGFLHDVLEDTRTRIDIIKDIFGINIANIITLLKGPPNNKEEAERIYYHQIIYGTEDINERTTLMSAQTIKIASRMHDLRTLETKEAGFDRDFIHDTLHIFVYYFIGQAEAPVEIKRKMIEQLIASGSERSLLNDKQIQMLKTLSEKYIYFKASGKTIDLDPYDFLQGLIDDLQKQKPNRPVVLAFEGMSGTGKSAITDKLKAQLKLKGKKVVIFDSRDYLLARPIRNAALDAAISSGESYIEQREKLFNFQRFKAEVLEPIQAFIKSNDQQTQFTLTNLYNPETGELDREDPFIIDRDTIIIVEGMHVLQEEFLPYYDATSFIFSTRKSTLNNVLQREMLKPKELRQPKEKILKRFELMDWPSYKKHWLEYWFASRFIIDNSIPNKLLIMRNESCNGQDENGSETGNPPAINPSEINNNPTPSQGTTPSKSYTNKGGTDEEYNPIIQTAIDNGTAQDISNEQITKQAKAILLSDVRFKEEDAKFAAKSADKIGFGEIRVIVIPGLPLNGHYGMGGEINQHTLPTVYVPKKLYDYLQQRHNKGDPDAKLELADYLYHKYVEMRLSYPYKSDLSKYTSELEKAHHIVEHNEYGREFDYLSVETYMNLKHARKKLLNLIEYITKTESNNAAQVSELLKQAKGLYESDKIHEAFIKAVESLRNIMQYQVEDYDIRDYCSNIAMILKKYRDIYRDESISDGLISLLEKYSVQGDQKEFAQILVSEYREDLTARRITYQVFTRVDEFRIRGLDDFPLYFSNKEKYKGRDTAIEWIEETPNLFVPDKIIFYGEDGRPDSIEYIKRVYDSPLNLLGLYLKIPSSVLMPGIIISGSRVAADTLQVAGKIFFFPGYNGTRARVIVGDKNIFTSIHLGNTRTKRPSDVRLKIIKCRNVPIGSYIKIPNSVLYSLYNKYGELEITNLYVTKGLRPTIPRVGDCPKYELKGYGGAPVAYTVGAGGQITKIRVGGIRGLPDIEKFPKKISRPAVSTKGKENFDKMIKIPVKKIKARSIMSMLQADFEDIKKTAESEKNLYKTGILFSTNKGSKTFYFSEKPDSGEAVRKALSAWCKAGEIDPSYLLVKAIIHIKSYDDYLNQSAAEDPLSFISVPTISELRDWKMSTLFLTWALKEITSRQHKEYDLKHLLIGSANGKTFFAGYENKIPLKYFDFSDTARLDPKELLRLGLVKFIPVCIAKDYEDIPQEGLIPDFMESYLPKRESKEKKKEENPAVERIKRLRIGKTPQALKLFTENKRFINWVIKRYFIGFLHLFSYEELFSAGEEGLLLASIRFNPDLGFKFSSYAEPYISGYIKRYIKSIMRFYRRETNLSEYTEGQDDELIDLDRLAEISDTGPSPEDIVIEADEQRQGIDRIKELSGYIKDPNAKLAFEIYAGIFDGELHTLAESGRIFFEQVLKGVVKAKIYEPTRKRGAYTRENMRQIIEKAKEDILVHLYGTKKAGAIIEAKKNLSRRKREEAKSIRQGWDLFIKNDLNKEDWKPIVFSPAFKGTSAVYQNPGMPLFKFDIQYAGNEICMELVEAYPDAGWAIFKFSCEGEKIKEILIEFSQGKPKGITDVPEYRGTEDILNLMKWRKWMMQVPDRKITPKGKMHFLVRKIDNYPFPDKGEISFSYKRKEVSIIVPKEHIGKIVTAGFTQGGKTWCMLKVYSDKNKVITVNIITWDHQGGISTFRVNENTLRKSKLTDKERKDIKDLLLDEITDGKIFTADILSAYLQKLKDRAQNLILERRLGNVGYDDGEHWKTLRQIEIIELYLKQSKPGKSPSKSYTGTDGTAQNATNEEIANQARSTLLNDERSLDDFKTFVMSKVTADGQISEQARKLAQESMDNGRSDELLKTYENVKQMVDGYALEFVKWVLRSYPPATGKRYLVIFQQGAAPLGIMLRSAIKRLGWTHLDIKDIYINKDIAGHRYYELGFDGVKELDRKGSNTDEEIFRYLYQEGLLDGTPLTLMDILQNGTPQMICMNCINNPSFWAGIGKDSKSIDMEIRLLFYNYRELDSRRTDRANTYKIRGLNQELDKDSECGDCALRLENDFPHRYDCPERLIRKEGRLVPELELQNPNVELRAIVAEQAAMDLVNEKLDIHEFIQDDGIATFGEVHSGRGYESSYIGSPIVIDKEYTPKEESTKIIAGWLKELDRRSACLEGFKGLSIQVVGDKYSYSAWRSGDTIFIDAELVELFHRISKTNGCTDFGLYEFYKTLIHEKSHNGKPDSDLKVEFLEELKALYAEIDSLRDGFIFDRNSEFIRKTLKKGWAVIGKWIENGWIPEFREKTRIDDFNDLIFRKCEASVLDIARMIIEKDRRFRRIKKYVLGIINGEFTWGFPEMPKTGDELKDWLSNILYYENYRRQHPEFAMQYMRGESLKNPRKTEGMINIFSNFFIRVKKGVFYFIKKGASADIIFIKDADTGRELFISVYYTGHAGAIDEIHIDDYKHSQIYDIAPSEDGAKLYLFKDDKMLFPLKTDSLGRDILDIEEIQGNTFIDRFYARRGIKPEERYSFRPSEPLETKEGHTYIYGANGKPVVDLSNDIVIPSFKGTIVYSLMTLLESNLNDGNRTRCLRDFVESTKGRVVFYAGYKCIIDPDYGFLKERIITVRELHDLIKSNQPITFILTQEERQELGIYDSLPASIPIAVIGNEAKEPGKSA